MVVVRQFAWANDRILASDDPALDTMNTEIDSQMTRETEDRELHALAKVHN